MQKMPIPSVALVHYPGVQRAALLGLEDLFAMIPLVRPGTAAPSVETVTPEHLPAKSFTALIFPPSLQETQARPDHPLVHWAQRRHAAGALACSVCSGAFWLGHAGLLDSRPATTHWQLEGSFRSAFPKADLQPEHILIDTGSVITAGGLMAWTDLGLHLADLWYGGGMVSALARSLLIDPAGREQRHYAGFRPALSHGDASILKTQRMMEERLAEDLPVEAMAAHAGLALRSFIRRFQSATGHSPAAYLQSLRMERARGLLESTAQPVSAIAWAVGYRDVPAFSRAFKSRTGLTPGACRDRFRTQAV
jgi:transcriptional regulator GlxA family with amidase domain